MAEPDADVAPAPGDAAEHGPEMARPAHAPTLPRHEVLITRPETEAAATAERVAALGLVPVLAPLLLVKQLAFEADGRIDGVVVTSGNAVDAVAGRPVPLYAVGRTTAQRARSAGFRVVWSADGDAADLVAMVRRRAAAGARLLLASGQGQGEVLARALQASGYEVVHRVAYSAKPVARLPAAARAALLGGRLGAALFLSAETARTFVRLLPPGMHGSLQAVEALTIGQAAADALAPLPWRRVRVSLGPTLDQVLALL